jgi:cell division protein FtsI/penicillin-binding protein 2
VANGGVLLKPYVVRELRGPTGKVLRRTPTRTVRRVVSRETARALADILTQVVESGTGSNARVPGVLVAGKTGTAQRVDPATGRYDPRRHVSSFVGFFPAEHPQVVGCVIIDRPAGAGWGSQVAAPCFRRVVEGLLFARSEPPELDETALASS